MIVYNPKNWLNLIFAFHRSDTFRMLLPAMIGMAIFSSLVAYIEIELLSLKYKSSIAMHSILGFALSLLLVFRTNTAYDRWWEGRRLWGTFVNHSRSLSIKLATFIPPDSHEERVRIRVLLSNYFLAARDHLREKINLHEWESHPQIDNKKLAAASHIPNAILLALTQEIDACQRKGLFDNTRFLMLNEELRSLAESMGACERIHNTPIPYSYSMFLKKIIFFYTITMPFGFVSEFQYAMIPIVVFIFYTFTSIELLAEEIEDPFGNDVNDLPTDELAERIQLSIHEIIQT